MKRIQKNQIKRDLQKKMVLLVGPRQVGKTWLAKDIMKDYLHPIYLNYDSWEDRDIILKENWLPNTDLLVLDEIHKMKNWKNFIKGIFDNRQDDFHILVTGSARLDAFRQTGDSLAGRYFVHNLLPISYKEALNEMKFPLDHIIERGGFPEPTLADSTVDAERWRNYYIDSLIKEDVLDFQNISQFKIMNMLVKMLRRRVGSPLSYASLAKDFDCSPNTIKKYIAILEALYIVFLVTPFSNNIARSIKKEPKLYFYDTGLVEGDAGIKFENYLAVSLMKHVFNLNNLEGKEMSLNYLRTKEKKEVDFALVENMKLISIIEAKNSDATLNAALFYFSNKYNVNAYQVVRYLRKERKVGNIEIVSAENFLQDLSI